MTRLELLKIVVGRARANGFEFRRWYTTRLGLPWINPNAAITLLESQRRYYALLFSHEFAVSFWKPGVDITFSVPSQTFDRVMPDGSIGTVTRKSFTRRSARPDAWRYHLREMALAEEPLRYIRKYLHVEEELDDTVAAEAPTPDEPSKPARPLRSRKKSPTPAPTTRSKPRKRPLPTDLPAFLRRPVPQQDAPSTPRKPKTPRFF
jgi:hypothetical protein